MAFFQNDEHNSFLSFVYVNAKDWNLQGDASALSGWFLFFSASVSDGGGDGGEIISPDVFVKQKWLVKLYVFSR